MTFCEIKSSILRLSMTGRNHDCISHRELPTLFMTVKQSVKLIHHTAKHETQ